MDERLFTRWFQDWDKEEVRFGIVASGWLLILLRFDDLKNWRPSLKPASSPPPLATTINLDDVRNNAKFGYCLHPEGRHIAHAQNSAIFTIIFTYS
jgi:hypothetical protein